MAKGRKCYVYRIYGDETELVDPSEYSLNPKTGKIVFSSLQPSDSKLSVSVGFDSSMRVACMITNYGEEAASIDHIGLTYNVAQRMEANSIGIKRKPISDIYELSSSSSSSSEIEVLYESSSSSE